MRGFASDNYAGAHPAVLAALAEANRDHAAAYGIDPWTVRANELLRARFGADAEPWLVWGGTAANVLALGSLCRTWEAVITPVTAHLQVDEAGAPERMAQVKLLTVDTPDGKLRPGDLEPFLARTGDEHAVQPRVVSIANSTELGTVYEVAELRALADAAHEHGMYLHVDGARLANAAVALGAGLGEITTAVGADVVSCGMTKNGAMGVEGVVFLNGLAPDGFKWIRKQHAQLASKMRFLSAQAIGLLEDDVWADNARNANAMARALAAAAGEVPGVRITQEVRANAVFAILPPGAADELRRHFPFYDWDPATGEVRWMCCWDTTPQDIDAFVAALREVCVAPSSA